MDANSPGGGPRPGSGLTAGAAGGRPYPTGRLLDGKPRAIVFDSSKCIGCRQCVEACKDWNELPRGDQYAISGQTWLTMEPPELEGIASVWGRNSCMHCEYPVCAAVCPVEAITKYEEGPVVIDQSVCIGCEYCIYACPWDVISKIDVNGPSDVNGKSDVNGRAAKCTMCADRISHDQTPFCVKACPVGALGFGLVEEMQTAVDARAAEVGARVYGQEEAGGTHVLHVLTHPREQHGLPEVPAERYPRHHIPTWKKITGVLTLTGGITGKMRAVTNAVRKPWRLKYRYWHRPEATPPASTG